MQAPRPQALAEDMGVQACPTLVCWKNGECVEVRPAECKLALSVGTGTAPAYLSCRCSCVRLH